MMSHNSTQEIEKTMRSQVALPDSLWEAAKKRCIDERISFKEFVVRAVSEYLNSHGAKAA